MDLDLLLVEGNPAEANGALADLGLDSNAGQYQAAIRAQAPDAVCHLLCPADGPAAFPAGAGLGDFDGLVIGGSGLHVRRGGNLAAVQRQVDLVRTAFDAGLPVLGSCWGLQVAVVAAGGDVAPSPNGREVGICRDLRLTPAGAGHALMAGKPTTFQSLALHYDEVTHLPAGAEVLASNGHSRVQAVAFTAGAGRFWGLQYHPEFDLAHMAGLIRRYADDMLAQAIFADRGALEACADALRALHRDPGDDAAAGRLAAQAEVVEPNRRRREIANWLNACADRKAVG